MTNLIDVLSKKDKDKIESYINAFAECPMDCSIDTLLRPWSDAKQNLYSIFGGNLILTKHISIAKTEDDILYELTNTDSSKCPLNTNFCRHLCEKLRYLWLNECINIKAVDSERNGEFGDIFYDLKYMSEGSKENFTVKMLTTNVYDGPTGEIFFTSLDTSLKLMRGMKFMKILAKLAKILNLYPEYEDFRLKHSMVFNQKNLEGDLCISIHPLDYMTMSDNEIGWHSCMSWQHEGCYRQGTVEMMNSPYVVVGYLKAKEDMLLPNNTYWNNKRWRELYIVEDRIITSVKPYPFFNDRLSAAIVNWLRELMNKQEEFCEPEHYDIEELTDFRTELMYNDFGNGAHPLGSYDKSIERTKPIKIVYSGLNQCMCCGNTNCYYETEGNLVCEDCYSEDYSTCDCCGERIYDGEGYYVDGYHLCDYCYSEKTVWTIDDSDEPHMKDDCTEIYVIADDAYTITYDNPKIYLYNLDKKDRFFTALYRLGLCKTRGEWAKVMYCHISEVIPDSLDSCEAYSYDELENAVEYYNKSNAHPVVDKGLFLQLNEQPFLTWDNAFKPYFPNTNEDHKFWVENLHRKDTIIAWRAAQEDTD